MADEGTGIIGYTYAKALEHQKNCDFRQHYCELNCGAKIFKREIEEHEKVCPEKIETCKKCELPIKINLVPKDQTHDCIEEMKKFLKNKIEQKSQLEFEFGINYDVMNNTCLTGHQLKAHYGLVRPYKNATP